MVQREQMRITKLLLMLSVAAGVAACDRQSETAQAEQTDALGPGEVAFVNGERIPESLFRRLGLNSVQKTAENLTDEERAALLDQLINLRLVASAGVSGGIDRERTIAAELELNRMQVIANAMLRRHIEDNPPTERELRALYEERMADLSGTEYNARHILVETRDKAEEIISLLDDGGDFASLAQEHSTGPTGPRGGQLDWFTPDRMVQPFSDAVQALEVGSYTQAPVQTQFGWHVILLEETRDRQPPGLESMRVELTTLAERQKSQAYVQMLRDAAAIEIVGE